VNEENRNKRLRLLIKKLNKERKKQAKQIDILCHDLIAAQRDFIQRLKSISFIANFYKSTIGSTELNQLLHTAAELMKEQVDGINVTFFLRQAENYALHTFESDQAPTFKKQYIENCFSPELIENVCASNRICTFKDLFAMGLQGNLVELRKISAMTIPLDASCSPIGFILVYRSSEKKLTADEISDISAVMDGLSKAIASCQGLLHSWG
jgi:hypothetical protein